jgi:cytoskeletal protein RodZ
MVPRAQAARLKPKLSAPAILLLGMVAVMAIQLVLNMALTQDAYYLKDLKSEKRDLTTQVQIISEQVDSLASPQNLADAAHKLGMVANPASVMIDLATDKVFGKPRPADAASAAVSANLVANSALVNISEFEVSNTAADQAETSVAQAEGVTPALALKTSLIPASPTR